ncbi:hypothetical protein N7O58_05400 [Enterococcus dispar]|uniref:hypothetical protein n=1 Tax=Enterococcus dispar TaxID=44009 RepID=UPI00189E2C0D|nr:hypothetical protein [Enterococcus dispar]MCU7357117.1 hypothetical protein [Enterococcus dispar]WCG32338.1 hypothetical protein PML78_09045 [Enterococcus dispar]
MLKEQEIFLNFMKERTVKGQEEQTEAILVDAFAKLATDEFTTDEFTAVREKLLPLIAPEYQTEVKEAMAHFASMLK